MNTGIEPFPGGVAGVSKKYSPVISSRFAGFTNLKLVRNTLRIIRVFNGKRACRVDAIYHDPVTTQASPWRSGAAVPLHWTIIPIQEEG